jgi:hypothetical protein
MADNLLVPNADYTLLTWGELEYLACEGDDKAERQMELNNTEFEASSGEEIKIHGKTFMARRQAAGLPETSRFTTENPPTTEQAPAVDLGKVVAAMSANDAKRVLLGLAEVLNDVDRSWLADGTIDMLRRNGLLK